MIDDQRKPATPGFGYRQMSLGPFEDGFYRVLIQSSNYGKDLGILVRGLTENGEHGDMEFRLEPNQELALGFPAKLQRD